MPDFRVFAITDLVVFAALATFLTCENLTLKPKHEILVRRLFVVFAVASIVCLAMAVNELITPHYPTVTAP